MSATTKEDTPAPPAEPVVEPSAAVNATPETPTPPTTTAAITETAAAVAVSEPQLSEEAPTVATHITEPVPSVPHVESKYVLAKPSPVWVEPYEHSNWGKLTIKAGKDGRDILPGPQVIKWPDGAIANAEIVLFAVVTDVHDHGHSTKVRSDVPHILEVVHGAKFYLALCASGCEVAS